MYEAGHVPPITKAKFLARLRYHGLLTLSALLLSLFIGMSGYRFFEHLTWIDAFLNSAMLIGGMGPVNAPQTDGGKIFAGVYAMFAGLLVIAAAGLLFAPFLHRMMHRIHWEDTEAHADREPDE